MFWGIYRVLRVLNIGDRARTSTNLLLRMKLRRSERPNLGLPPERYGWSPREKPRATEDQARVARIRQETLLAEERVKRLEDDLKRSIDESKDRILRMKLRLEEEAWRRYEQTKLPTPTEDDSERGAPEDDYQTGANYGDYSQTPAYTTVPKSVYESLSPRLRSSINWVDYSQLPTVPERPRRYYSGGHEEDLLDRKVRASTPMRDYERPRSYYSGGREEDLSDRETQASTPIQDYEDGFHTGFRHEPPPERPRMTDDKADGITKLAEALAGIMDSKKLSHVGHDDNLRRYVARQAIDAKELPTFSGLPEEWPVFLEHFESTTKECQFSNAENMARLRKALKGRAKDTVSALLALPGNVDRVISTLQRRFGRPEFIVQSLIEKAKAMKSFREGDMIGIIDFANAVVNLSSTMELLKSDGHLRNPELRQQLVAKLPYALQLQWGEYVSRYLGSFDLTLQDFSKWLSDRADAASLLITPKASEEQHQPLARSSEDRRHVTGAGTTHCFSISIQEAENKLTELDITERKEFAMNNHLCFNCLRQHH